MFGSQAGVGIPQYNMIVKYDLKGYNYQAALPDEHHTLMDASVEAVDGNIVLNFKSFLFEEGGNDIIVDGSWYPGRSGTGIFDPIGCWCCSVVIFTPLFSHLVKYPLLIKQP